MTAKRTLPYYNEKIAPLVEEGKKVLVAAHGNSLRSIIKQLENLSPEEIVNTELETGVPIVYRLDKEGEFLLLLSSNPCSDLRAWIQEPP